MADKGTNTAVVKAGDRDRVAMLSVAKDGTADQHDPEFIDKEFAEKATTEQFKQQAVSAVDHAERTAKAQEDEVDQGKQDPFIADLKAKHESAEKAGESAAKSVVSALTKD